MDANANPDLVLEMMLGGDDLGHYEVERAVGNARNEPRAYSACHQCLNGLRHIIFAELIILYVSG